MFFPSKVYQVNRVVLILLVSLTFVCVRTANALYFKNMVNVEKLEIGKEGRGRDVRVTLKLMPFSKQYPKQEPKYPNFGFYGVGDRRPGYSVAIFEVWLGKIRKGVPVSAYLDLTEIHKINLVIKSTNEFSVVIDGGDAGNAYSAILAFKNDKFVKRRIVAGEDTDILIQETTYFQTE